MQKVRAGLKTRHSASFAVFLFLELRYHWKKEVNDYPVFICMFLLLFFSGEYKTRKKNLVVSYDFLRASTSPEILRFFH